MWRQNAGRSHYQYFPFIWKLSAKNFSGKVAFYVRRRISHLRCIFPLYCYASVSVAVSNSAHTFTRAYTPTHKQPSSSCSRFGTEMFSSRLIGDRVWLILTVRVIEISKMPTSRRGFAAEFVQNCTPILLPPAEFVQSLSGIRTVFIHPTLFIDELQKICTSKCGFIAVNWSPEKPFIFFRAHKIWENESSRVLFVNIPQNGHKSFKHWDRT